MSDCVCRTRAIAFLATFMLFLIYLFFSAEKGVVSEDDKLNIAEAQQYFLEEEQPTPRPYKFFSSRCKQCFDGAALQRCAVLSPSCAPSSYVHPSLSSLSKFALSTAQCTRTHKIANNPSIDCIGMIAIEKCHTSLGCLGNKVLLAKVTGILVALDLEVRALLEEPGHGESLIVNNQTRDMSHKSMAKESTQLSEPLNEHFQKQSTVSAHAQLLHAGLRQASSGINIDGVEVIPFNYVPDCQLHFPYGRCLPQAGARGKHRSPSAANIVIRGTRHTRAEIVALASQKMRKRLGFNPLFPAQFRVESISKDGNKSRFVVKFTIIY